MDVSCNSLAVIMPVYNEEGSIAKVLENWTACLNELDIDYRIHVYNDGSKDATLPMLHKLSSGYGGRIVVHDKANSGHGPTILAGYNENADKFDWIFQVDSDDEMDASGFKELWRRRKDFDFLVGRRDGRPQPFARKLISFLSRLTVTVFYGKTVWDVNSPYRLMRSSAFKEIFSRIPSCTFAPNLIISGCAGKNALRFCECPVQCKSRSTGEVSIRKWKLLKASARSFVQTIIFSMKNR